VDELREWALSAELLAEYVQELKARGQTFVQIPPDDLSERYKAVKW
jgi:hypothetical protein